MVPMTEKLFDTDPYGRAFDAVVLSAERTDKGLEIILDRTLFFPEEGGQLPDRGMLNGFPVEDVQIKEDVITHLVRYEGECIPEGREEIPAQFVPGSRVTGEIDWKFRFSNMQNHTGEHIFSGLVHRHFGYDNVGFHLGEHLVTMDYSGQLGEDDLRMIEREANEAVWRNIPVNCAYPDRDELAAMEYRSKKELTGAIRIVTIEGIDVCACCAPHVLRTGEIGLIKVLRSESLRGGTRVTIVCGDRAYEAMQELYRNAQDAGRRMKLPAEEIVSGVARLLEEADGLRAEKFSLENRIAGLLFESVPGDAEDVFLFTEEMDPLAQRNLVNDLADAHPGYACVFCGREEKRFIAASRNRDSRRVSGLLREKLGARGGGKPEMVQGSVTAKEEEIRAVLGLLSSGEQERMPEA